MKVLKSKRSILPNAFLLGFGVLFGFTGITFVISFIFNHSSLKSLVLLILAFGSFGFSIYFLIYYMAHFPTIEIDDEKVEIKTPFENFEIGLQDIQSVDLFRKSPMTFLWETRAIESTSITTKKNREIIIWDRYYQNIAVIKARLKEIQHEIQSRNSELNTESIIKE